MPAMTPAELAAKWANRTGAATQDVVAGVNRVTEHPGRKAAAQVAVWAANTQAAQEKWARRVQAGSLEDWKARTAEGANRIASGVQAKKSKVEQFWQEFGPFQDAVTSRVRQMPRGNLEQNVARMIEQVRGTSQFKRTR
jgi:hypothetical protein